MEEIIFEIICYGGNAKSLVYEAIKSAEEKNFDKVESLLKEADEYLLKAHNMQTDIIQKEAKGENQPVSILFVHAQDHLMNAIEVRTLADHLISMHKRISNLENK